MGNEVNHCHEAQDIDSAYSWLRPHENINQNINDS